MLVFPNCKINLGLHVVEKRSDGYHNIETAFYPINWCDALEVIQDDHAKQEFNLTQSGLGIDGGFENNLVYKAWQRLKGVAKLPPIHVHLHKNLPMGAGLGGGSSDAAFFINLMHEKFNLKLSEEERLSMASELGSDCAFFIKNNPIYAFGRGNEFEPLHINLSAYYILVIYPGIHSNTKEAYNGLIPKQPANELKFLLEKEPVSNWKDFLVNDFESSLFAKYPQIQHLKQQLYNQGAIYASMSGSGSAVYGLFSEAPELSLFSNFQYCLQKPELKVL